MGTGTDIAPTRAGGTFGLTQKARESRDRPRLLSSWWPVEAEKPIAPVLRKYAISVGAGIGASKSMSTRSEKI